MEVTFDRMLKELKKYYPIGIKEVDPNYYKSQEMILYVKACNSKFESHIEERWRSFMAESERDIPEILAAKTYSHESVPSYGAELSIKKKKLGYITHTQSIKIEMSVLGPYFTIYGLDCITLNPEKNQYVAFEPLLCVSPENDYKKVFEYLRQRLSDNYGEYLFVPYSLLKEIVDDLFVPGGVYLGRCGASVYQAFFNSEDITQYKFQGNYAYE